MSKRPFARNGLAEKFLRVGNPAAIGSSLDPLGLVQISRRRASIKTDHKAMISIRDYIESAERSTASVCSTTSTAIPLAGRGHHALHLGSHADGGRNQAQGSGREVTAAGQQAIDALKDQQLVQADRRSTCVTSAHPSRHLARAAERSPSWSGTWSSRWNRRSARPPPSISRASSTNMVLWRKGSAAGARGKRPCPHPEPGHRRRSIHRCIGRAQRLGGVKPLLYAELKWARGSGKRALDNGLDDHGPRHSAARTGARSMPLPDDGHPGGAAPRPGRGTRRKLAGSGSTKGGFYRSTRPT